MCVARAKPLLGFGLGRGCESSSLGFAAKREATASGEKPWEMTTRIAPGVGANLLGQHSAERNQDATTYVGNLDPQVPPSLDSYSFRVLEFFLRFARNILFSSFYYLLCVWIESK